jgi:hypothetical protein
MVHINVVVTSHHDVEKFEVCLLGLPVLVCRDLERVGFSLSFARFFFTQSQSRNEEEAGLLRRVEEKHGLSFISVR